MRRVDDLIVYDLACDQDHRFEGWFGSSSDFDDQKARGLLACPQCGSAKVTKAPMAPAVPAKSNTRQESASLPVKSDGQDVSNTPMPAEVEKALEALAKAQALTNDAMEAAGYR